MQRAKPLSGKDLRGCTLAGGLALHEERTLEGHRRIDGDLEVFLGDVGLGTFESGTGCCSHASMVG